MNKLQTLLGRAGALAFAIVLVSAGLAWADAPDPVLPLTGSATSNADGSHTLTVSGQWVWTTHHSDCNKDRYAVGWAMDWNDPTQPGNAVGSAQGVSVDVGAAAANSYNPADNAVSYYNSTPRCGTYDSSKGYNSGSWGPMSHTYPASVTEVKVCVVTYDIHGDNSPKDGDLTAGGSSHNKDNSVEKNENTPLGNGCFTSTFKFDHPEIALVKDGPASATRGDTITYTFVATNPGDVPLSNVRLVDARCDAGTISAPSKGSGNGDDKLDPGESWSYTCTHHITAADPDPLPNTANVTGTPPNGPDVSASDSHLVDLLPRPEISIIKSGPGNASVGDKITYTLQVSTLVDNPLHDVEVSDPVCDGRPELQAKTRGDNDDLLELGEVWIYTCSHVAKLADVPTLHNTAVASGKDRNGTPTTDRDTHDVDVREVEGKIIRRPPPPSGILPFTGSNTSGLTLLALSMMLSGAGALWISRKATQGSEQ